MYLYLGKVSLGYLSGYLWLLGRRLYLKLGWRPRDTYFLGNLGDPLSIAVRLKRLMPRPVDVRRAAAVLARALAASLYVARRCRDSPRWRIRAWEAESLLLDAASALAWAWPAARRSPRRELGGWARGLPSSALAPRRGFAEEARKRRPDLSGMGKAP